jgi:phosphatidate cytidylyltransferase
MARTRPEPRALGPEPARRGRAVRGALALRVASGVVAVPFLVGVAYFGEPDSPGWHVYCTVIVVATALAAWEVRGMLRSGGYAPLDAVLLGLAIVLPIDVAVRGGQVGPDGILLVALAVLGGLVRLVLRASASAEPVTDHDRGLVDWALSLALALYLGGLMQFYLPLRQRPDGAVWVIALLVLSWVCDSCAYFVGRAFGRARLAPRISPSKSVEGAVAGLIGAAVVGALIGVLTGHGPALLAGYGVAIGLATVLGDLAESLLKRQTGVKDSGVLIPGHGGILDRMDSLLFCAPVAFAYVLVLA